MPKHKVDALIDFGAAEAYFSLGHIESAEKIVIVEGDSEWIDALKFTFENYMDKVLILPYFVSDKDDMNRRLITLDTIYKNNLKELHSFIVKMDIEGYEEKCLKSSMLFINNAKEITFICACYHHRTAKENINHFFSDNDFNVEYSDGDIYFSKSNELNTLSIGDFDKNEIPLRKALICGRKKE